jgi:hypothetical protein
MFQAKYAELVRILLKDGVDVHAQAQQGRLAEIERILFQHGAGNDNMDQIPFCGVYYTYGFFSHCQTIELGRKSCGNCICTG